MVLPATQVLQQQPQQQATPRVQQVSDTGFVRLNRCTSLRRTSRRARRRPAAPRRRSSSATRRTSPRASRATCSPAMRAPSGSASSTSCPTSCRRAPPRRAPSSCPTLPVLRGLRALCCRHVRACLVGLYLAGIGTQYTAGFCMTLHITLPVVPLAAAQSADIGRPFPTLRVQHQGAVHCSCTAVQAGRSVLQRSTTFVYLEDAFCSVHT